MCDFFEIARKQLLAVENKTNLCGLSGMNGHNSDATWADAHFNKWIE